jgi:putative membrane protein
VKLPSQDLTLPFVMYLGNFGFATVMSMGAGIYPPIFLGLLTGSLPLTLLYNRAKAVASGQTVPTSEVTTLKIPVVSVRGAK